MPVRLFVGNLPYDATEAELREHFAAVAPLSYVSLPMDRESGRPRGFAFVEFHDQAHAEEAIRRFHNQPFKGRPLAVNEARARESGPGTGRIASAPPARAQRGVEPDAAATPSRGGGPNRSFGPDAPPRRSRKHANRHVKLERGPKRPIRERLGGQFFGGDVEDADADDLDEETLAPWVDDPKSEDNA
jgi:RNA recognition motif-containing protein